MIKNVINILTLIFSINLYCQSYKSLKGKDTTYFYFDYSKQLDKKINSVHSITKDTTYFYTFKENSPDERIQRRFNLIRSKYLTFGDMDINKQADIKTVTRCFLKKNKDIVIYPKDLQGEKMEKVIISMGLKTVVYIIDVSEKKKRKFIAREVRLSYGSFIEI